MGGAEYCSELWPSSSLHTSCHVRHRSFNSHVHSRRYTDDDGSATRATRSVISCVHRSGRESAQIVTTLGESGVCSSTCTTCTRGRSAVSSATPGEGAWGQNPEGPPRVTVSVQRPSARHTGVQILYVCMRKTIEPTRVDQGSTSPARSDLPDKKKTSTEIVWQLTEALLGRCDVNLWNRLEQLFGLSCARKSHRGVDAQRSVHLPDH